MSDGSRIIESASHVFQFITVHFVDVQQTLIFVVYWARVFYFVIVLFEAVLWDSPASCQWALLLYEFHNCCLRMTFMPANCSSSMSETGAIVGAATSQKI